MTSPHLPTGPDRVSERVVPSLLRLARAVDGALRSGGSAFGLSPAQAETLRFAGTVRPDMATVGQLARVLGVRHATVVGIVAPLVSRGLLERRPHSFDGRQRTLCLTDAGQDLRVRLDELSRELALALDRLDPADAAGLETGIGAIVAALRSSGALVIAAPCAGCIHFRPDAAPGTASPHRCELLQRYLTTIETRMACPEHQPAG